MCVKGQLIKYTRNIGKLVVQRGLFRVILSTKFLNTLLYLFLTFLFAGFLLNIWHSFLEILFGGGNHIFFSLSYFQYLFFHLEFNHLGEVPWSLFGKIIFGVDAKTLGNFEVQTAPSRS